ncbi:MAG: tetratricopeptide repeat protein [Bacteroidales bacterium]|nr:tetratricopeptide repeat protein [Bacteroidales bacterium]
MKNILTLLLLFCISKVSFSQNAPDTSALSTDQLMIVADEFRNQFEHLKALNAYKALIKRDSLNLKAIEYASDMHASLGEYGSSIKLLRRLNSKDTSNTRILNKLALSLQSHQQSREAANIYKRLVKQGNSNFSTLKNLGDCYWMLGKRDSAEIYYKVADFVNGKSLITKLNLSQIAYLKKDLSSAKIYASRGVDLDSSYVPLRKQLGLIHYRLDEYSKALEQYNFLIERGDSSENILKYAGACNFFLGDFDKSIPLLSEALKTDSTDTETLFYLGSSLSHKGKSEEAIEIFNDILYKLRPDSSLLYKLHNQLGIAYSNMNKNMTAYNSFSEALNYNPTDSKLLFQMAMVRGGTNDKSGLEESKRLLERYLEAIRPKGDGLTAEEVILRERAKMYIERLTEELFMIE